MLWIQEEDRITTSINVSRKILVAPCHYEIIKFYACTHSYLLRLKFG